MKAIFLLCLINRYVKKIAKAITPAITPVLIFIPINREINKNRIITRVRLHSYGFYGKLHYQSHRLLKVALKMRIGHYHYDK